MRGQAAEMRPSHQLLALIRQRWRMIRSGPLRWAIGVAAIAPILLIALGMLSLRTLPPDQAVNIALATPTLYLGFVLLAIIAPLVSGGGYELYPPDQLVAFPIRPQTVFRSTLVLAPANLAWILNVIALFAITSFASGDISWGPTSRTLLTVGVFVAAATVGGHALGWIVVGLRQTRRGRALTSTAGLLAIALVLIIAWSDKVLLVLDRSPTRRVLLSAYDGYNGRYVSWVTGLVLLGVAILLAMKVGEMAAAWALRRPGDHADRSSTNTVTRRRPTSSILKALVITDQASIWRSVPLRRGLLVLIAIPGGVAALAGMSWQSLVLVPGLIAAGSGLLFGINAFTLDSSGAVWLSTLPNWATWAFVSKMLVFSEVTLAAVLSALIGGSLRSPSPASSAEVTAAIASALTCAAIVVVIGMRSSVRFPYRAELRGPRDTPASPGVMAAQSIRFATVTTLASLYFGALSLSGAWWIPIIGAVPLLAGCILHLRATAQAWAHPHVRAHVVMTVAGG